MKPEMKLRDYFAAHIAAGWISAYSLPSNECPDCEDIAEWSYELADAMIEERKPAKL